MVTQRRYSVTGQTPPDDAEALKAAASPKLHALDTAVPTTRGLCESAAEPSKALPDGAAAALARGRKMSPTCTVTRTSSKRSATQLPSPSSPTCKLPPKMARYRLSYHDAAMDLDTDTDSDVTDVFRDDDDWALASQPASLPSTPDFALPLSALCLPDAEDEAIDVEDLALSPPHSRNHSLDCAGLDERAALQRDWAVFKQANALLESQIMHLSQHTLPHAILPPPSILLLSSPLPQSSTLLQTSTLLQLINLPQPSDPPPTSTRDPSPTFLTLPPEIRYQIYRLDNDLVKSKPLCYCLENAGSKIQHPFAGVSTQVRREALAIFYIYNTWVIKTEYKIFYEAFHDWIIRLGDGAGALRLVNLSVRGKLFKPVRSHLHSANLSAAGGGLTAHATQNSTAASARNDPYSPPDGEASFHINLSEMYDGGRVQLTRNDGTTQAGERGRLQLEKMVNVIWEKRIAETLNGQDWIDLVDGFLTFVGRVGAKW